MATDLPGADRGPLHRSIAQASCVSYERLHSLTTTDRDPALFPGLYKEEMAPQTEALSTVHTIRDYLLGILKWGVGMNESETLTLTDTLFMTPTIASILNLMSPDMMVILLIVLLLFGAKKLPELARGMGRAVKEFSAARDEIERELGQPGSKARKSEVLDAKAVLPAER
jgi:sec-independent protein translocase protein TatA